MYSVSDLYKAYCSQPGRIFSAKCDINGVTYDDNSIEQFVIVDSLVPLDNFNIGAVVSSKLTISLITTNTIAKNAKIEPYVRPMGVSGDVEWLPLGKFWIDTRSNIKNSLWTFTCYDRLILTNQAYITKLTYPATHAAIVNEICTQLGISLDSSVSLANHTIDIKPDDGLVTMHDMLSYIAMINNTCCKMTKDGKLTFIKFAAGMTAVTVLTPDDYNTVTASSIKCYTKFVVTYNDDGDTYTAGSDTDENGDDTLEFENPYMTQDMLNTVYTNMKNFSFMPMNLSGNGKPYLETGDYITVQQTDGSSFLTVLLTTTLTYGGGVSISASAPAYSTQKSEFDFKGSLTQSLKQIIKKAVKQDDKYYGVSISKKYGIKITNDSDVDTAVLNSDGLTFTNTNNKQEMFNAYGLDTNFIKSFKNMIHNSQFEVYNANTKIPMNWNTTAIISNESCFFGSVSLKLTAGQTAQTGNYKINPQWYADTAIENTRVSFYRKGAAVKVEVFDETGAAYTLTDNDGNTGTSLLVPEQSNWIESRYTFSFAHGTHTQCTIKFTNTDTANAVYIDAVQLEPDYTGMWPSFYTDGPLSDQTAQNSADITDIQLTDTELKGTDVDGVVKAHYSIVKDSSGKISTVINELTGETLTVT